MTWPRSRRWPPRPWPGNTWPCRPWTGNSSCTLRHTRQPYRANPPSPGRKTSQSGPRATIYPASARALQTHRWRYRTCREPHPPWMGHSNDGTRPFRPCRSTDRGREGSAYVARTVRCDAKSTSRRLRRGPAPASPYPRAPPRPAMSEDFAMSLLRTRSAVSPLRRRFDEAAPVLPSVDALVAVERPEEPLHCLRPATIAAAARRLRRGASRATTLYAVKCNPEPSVLRASGTAACAISTAPRPPRWRWSAACSRRPASTSCTRSRRRGAIREACAAPWRARLRAGQPENWRRSCTETGAGAAEGLGLFVRLALPKGTAVYDLSGKFGAAPEEAAALLRAARPHAARLGLCFHVGSQMPGPAA